MANVNVVPDGGYDHEEIEKLREWRHGVVTPTLAAAVARIKYLEDEIREIRPRVEQMARADEIADAVTEHIRHARRGLLSTGEKLGGLAVGGAAVASVIVRFFH